MDEASTRLARAMLRRTLEHGAQMLRDQCSLGLIVGYLDIQATRISRLDPAVLR